MNYGKNEFAPAKARSTHGVRVGVDQLLCITNAIVQMPREFGSEALVDYLVANGSPVSKKAVDRQLKRLGSLVRLKEEKKVNRAWARTWVKVV